MEVLTEEKVPVLRFPGFEAEWGRSLLGRVAKVTSGGTPNRSNPFFWHGKIPWVTTSLINFNVITEAEEYITDAGIENSSAKVFPVGTLLMAMYGQGKTRGKVAILGIEASTNQACAAIILDSKKAVNEFVFQYLGSRYEEVRSLSNSGSQENLNAEILKNITLFLPSLPEQQKIAAFLNAIDDKIGKLTRKKMLLEQYKKGVMQQLFSQENRFKDDKSNDYPDWEVKQANEVFGSHSNKNHNGDLPILAITQDRGTVLRDSIDIRIQSSEQSIKSYKIVEVGDFIISLRSFQGGIEYSEVMGICSPAYTILKPKIPICNDFFKFYFKKESFIEQLSSTSIGIRDGKQISYDAFSTLTLPYPSLEEQQKIAAFLSSFDAKIEAVEKQIQAAQTFKKGLLQQLFV